MSGFKHGFYNTDTHMLWRGMIARCSVKSNSGYPNYGGRGIKVCNRWRNSFEDFIADMGWRPTPEHSLDRINGNGNYEPGNVRWATVDVQNRNRVTNIYIEWQGQRMVASDWETKLGFPKGMIINRLQRGWSKERAVSTPPNAPRPINLTCRRGHPYTPESTGTYPDGTRYCRICRAASWSSSTIYKRAWEKRSKARRASANGDARQETGTEPSSGPRQARSAT